MFVEHKYFKIKKLCNSWKENLKLIHMIGFVSTKFIFVKKKFSFHLKKIMKDFKKWYYL